MPDPQTRARVRKARRRGKSPSSQAGEFVREEMHHIREGKHGARSTKQAIAIGLSKARRAGIELPAPKRGRTSETTRRRARRDRERGHHPRRPSARRSRATLRALQREGRRAASPQSLAKQARSSARRRSPTQRSAAARRAARSRTRRS
jgi:hypothetical protein